MSKPSSPADGVAESRRRSIWPLWAALGVSLAPVVAAVLLYLNPQWMPSERHNYGELLAPQVDVPPAGELALTTLEGEPFDLRSLEGQWIMITADQAACPESCARKLFIMRQTHASTGKNVVRIERVWLVTGDDPVPPKVLEAYPGMHMLRVQDAAQLSRLFGEDPAQNHIWMIDPLNHLMMQFPEDADPIRLRKDLGRLLFASQVG